MYVLPLRLPSISLLNGSAVTDSEREDSERFFIRYYLDYPERELPYRYAAFTNSCAFVTCMCELLNLTAQRALFILRYHSLVTKYGRLEPLAEIDLRPRCRARVEVHCEEKVEQVWSTCSGMIASICHKCRIAEYRDFLLQVYFK